MANISELIEVGWREWVALPELGLHAIKAKIDTGAKTSALHASSVERIRADNRDRVRFVMHPLQRSETPTIQCEADLLDVRDVTDSGGHKESRLVIETPLKVGEHSWPVQITLTDRKGMRFRMLIGRRAMVGRIVVNPKASYCVGKLNPTALYNARR
ncbi:MAG: RimK/LysX family protein [Pseudomonadota bacterium]